MGRISLNNVIFLIKNKIGKKYESVMKIEVQIDFHYILFVYKWILIWSIGIKVYLEGSYATQWVRVSYLINLSLRYRFRFNNYTQKDILISCFQYNNGEKFGSYNKLRIHGFEVVNMDVKIRWWSIKWWFSLFQSFDGTHLTQKKKKVSKGIKWFSSLWSVLKL